MTDNKWIYTATRQGRIHDFHGGGGAVGSYAHHEHEAQSPLWQGSRARLRSLEVLGGGGGGLMLSHAIWTYFLAFWYKMGFKKNTVNKKKNWGGGAHLLRPPSKSATGKSWCLKLWCPQWKGLNYWESMGLFEFGEGTHNFCPNAESVPKITSSPPPDRKN